jgi:6-phosphogluconolactonase (cycloisomerase 2 family)
MSKKIGLVVALVGMCALSLFLLSCGSSSSRPSGVLYVLTQGSNGVGNNVSSFAIDLGSGGLSLINSNAPSCATAGACGLPLQIVLDPKGSAAFVLNQGVASAAVSPTVYPYTVNSDGSLSSPGTPVAWNCISPTGTPCASFYPDNAVAMVRDAAGQFLFVIDQGTFPSPTTCPQVGTGVRNATDAANFLGCPSISVFATQAGSSTLTFVSQSSTYQSPFFISKIPTALSGITVSAPAEELLFVTSNKDLTNNHNDNTVSVYGVGSDGTLTEKTGSPYSTSTINPLAVLAVNTNPTGLTTGGVFVYVGSAGNASGALDAFQVCTVIDNVNCVQTDLDNAKLLPIGTPTSTGQKPVGMVVDPTNNFLYVVCEDQSAVYGYRISTTPGTLNAQSPSNLPTGSQPVALAMHSSGKFLYTSNSSANNISGFTLSTTSGSMSSLPAVNSPAGPSGMAAR